MQTLKIIKDADTGSNFVEPEKYSERRASRAVVFDKEGKVALVYSSKNQYHKLPGGGVEEGEDLETAVRREVTEEVGCTLENIKELGIVEEYRNETGLHQISYGYTANVLVKGIPQLEPKEVIEQYITKWLDLDEAIKILETERSIEHYHGKFMCLREITFLKEARENIT